MLFGNLERHDGLGDHLVLQRLRFVVKVSRVYRVEGCKDILGSRDKLTGLLVY